MISRHMYLNILLDIYLKKGGARFEGCRETEEKPSVQRDVVCAVFYK